MKENDTKFELLIEIEYRGKIYSSTIMILDQDKAAEWTNTINDATTGELASLTIPIETTISIHPVVTTTQTFPAKVLAESIITVTVNPLD